LFVNLSEGTSLTLYFNTYISFFSFGYLFWGRQYWGLNSGPCPC
jgi:hypothetical protein